MLKFKIIFIILLNIYTCFGCFDYQNTYKNQEDYNATIYKAASNLVLDDDIKSVYDTDEVEVTLMYNSESINNVTLAIIDYKELAYTLNESTPNTFQLTLYLNNKEMHYIEMEFIYLSESNLMETQLKEIFIFSKYGKHYLSNKSYHDAKFNCYLDSTTTDNPSYEEYNYFYGIEVNRITPIYCNDEPQKRTTNSNLIINGTIRIEDITGDFQYLNNIYVEIIGKNNITNEKIVKQTYTDFIGDYRIEFTQSELDEISVNDIDINIYSKGGNINVVNSSNTTYCWNGNVLCDFSYLVWDCDIDIVSSDFDLDEMDLFDSFKVHQAAEFGAYYVELLDGNRLDEINIKYPSSDISKFDGQKIHIDKDDVDDWDVILHEYGHYIQKKFDFLSNISGEHNFGICLATKYGKQIGAKLAWQEGWPTYFSISSQLHLNAASYNLPNVGDDVYTDVITGDTNDINISIETPLDNKCEYGEFSESVVAAFLLDIADDYNIGEDDRIEMGYSYVWNVIKNNKCLTLDEFNDILMDDLNALEQSKIGKVMSNLTISPSLDVPSDGTTIVVNNPTFSWIANGGKLNYENDRFNLVFYNNQYQKLWESSPVTDNEITLTANQWHNVLELNNNSNMFWAVKAYQTDEFISGYYLSEFYTLNVSSGHQFSYEYNSVSTHISHCLCGYEVIESHYYTTFKNGKKCKYCLHYTTGPTITPINSSRKEKNENE